jgi:hypothetical protein
VEEETQAIGAAVGAAVNANLTVQEYTSKHVSFHRDKTEEDSITTAQRWLSVTRSSTSLTSPSHASTEFADTRE